MSENPFHSSSYKMETSYPPLEMGSPLGLPSSEQNMAEVTCMIFRTLFGHTSLGP